MLSRRSFVAYAVHRSLQPVLSAYAHASFDNLTLYKGMLSETREHYHGPSNAEGYVSSPQDVYLPSTIQTIHYLTPGFMTQQEKPLQLEPMVRFGSACNPASNSSRAAATIASTSTGGKQLFSDRFFSRRALQPN
jgi:hypothetical protein